MVFRPQDGANALRDALTRICMDAEAAVDAGRYTGFWGTMLGGISHLITGNAVPGIVLGILIGKSAEESGYKSGIVKTLIAVVVIMFLAIAYFRGFFDQFMV